MLWKCDGCGRETNHLTICWGTCSGHKVDILDYFCPHCPSNKLTFQGTKEEREKFWEEQWKNESEFEEEENVV